MYTDYNEENNEENLYYEEEKKPDKEKIKRIVFFVLVFCVLVVLIIIIAKACSNKNANNGGTSLNNNSPVISLSRQEISVFVDDEFTLYYDVLNANQENPVVAWYSEDSSIASVNDEGIVTGKKEGTTNIVALYNQNGEIYSSKCSVVVTTKVITLETIKILQENIVLKKGSNPVLLQIALAPVEASSQKLVFKTDNPSVATVSDEGYVNAIDVGTTTITVSSEDGKVSDSISVEVTQTTTVINPTNIQIISLANTLTVGKTTQLYAQILPSNATNQNVTWTSTNPSVATVTNNGLIKGIKPGNCTIMASTLNNISATLDITVISDVVAVSSVSILDGTSHTMTVGGTKLLTYAISPSNATNKNVIITSSDENVAKVDSNGIIAARNPGTTLITVTTEDGNKTAFLNLTVTTTTSSEGSTSGGDTNGESSSGSSSGGNTSGGSSSSGGGSSSGNSGSTSCQVTNDSSVRIEDNDDNGITSAKSWSNAEDDPFEKSVNLIVTVNECIKDRKYNYKVYKGASAGNVATLYKSGNSLSSGTTISLTDDGYYRILITSVAKDTGITLSKTYYVVIKKKTTTVKPSLKVTLSLSGTNRGFKPTITNSSSVNAKIYRCTLDSTTTKSCAISTSSTLAYDGLVNYYSTTGAVKIVCYQAIDTNNSNNKSYKYCYYVSNGGVAYNGN